MNKSCKELKNFAVSRNWQTPKNCPFLFQMSEIADLTYNVVAFSEIMQMIWKRLNDHGKNWRHVYKSLVLLEYLIKTGSEKVSYTQLSTY